MTDEPRPPAAGDHYATSGHYALGDLRSCAARHQQAPTRPNANSHQSHRATRFATRKLANSHQSHRATRFATRKVHGVGEFVPVLIRGRRSPSRG